MSVFQPPSVCDSPAPAAPRATAARGFPRSAAVSDSVIGVVISKTIRLRRSAPADEGYRTSRREPMVDPAGVHATLATEDYALACGASDETRPSGGSKVARTKQ